MRSAPGRERVRVLDKGVDTDAFAPRGDREAIKARLGISGPMVIAVGALKKRKGFDVLIEAMTRITSGNAGHLRRRGRAAALQQQADAAG